jgi:hypothetical protein
LDLKIRASVYLKISDYVSVEAGACHHRQLFSFPSFSTTILIYFLFIFPTPEHNEREERIRSPEMWDLVRVFVIALLHDVCKLSSIKVRGWIF